jgi:rhodanese-related sulfurtransferase
VTSLKGTNALRERGLAVRRLPFGVPEWKAAGLPLDKTDLQTAAKS